MQGLILIDKPKDLTSFSAVSKIKRLASEKRVGHTGTLDPLATGVLPILLGRATSLSSLMLDADKRYIARVKLGIKTDTDDITGQVLEEKEVNISDCNLEKTINSFIGKISQVPPMYSALKKGGVRLYDLARQGKKIDIPARDIEVFSIKLISGLDESNEFVIDCHVSKGTYIRSLARDIGEALGVGATLTGLRRTFAAGFNIESCISLDKINEDNICEFILNEEMAVKHLREIKVTEKQAIRFCNGGQLSFDRINIKDMTENELFRIKYADKLLGIGFADFEKSEIGIKCVINNI